MNIAELAIRGRVVTSCFTLLLLAGGYYAYLHIGRLEDPEFTIKDAVVITAYPGASAYEVEREVTDVIERAVQQLAQLDEVTSHSEAGLSMVTASMKDRYGRAELPQVWDELRRKVQGAQSQLPPGAGPSIVNDDFGDVFGIFFALTGDGHTMAEMEDAAETLQRELLLVRDVAKVALFGVQPEAIYIEMSREKMARLGITQQQLFNALTDKNVVANAGYVRAGGEYLRIDPSGVFTSPADLTSLLIASGGGRLVYLGDVAAVRRGYVEPARPGLRYNAHPAVGIGISMVSGGNVVAMGDAVLARLEELKPGLPLGMELGVVNLQSRDVTLAVRGFVNNLIAAIIIVVVVLLFAMGLRSGLIIGAVLLITIAATILVLYLWGVALERISLGALIIALGMLVDNAIVVTEGMKTRIESGIDRIQAAREVVGQSMWPLLGATVIAVLAFAPIGLSPDSTGEFCRSLFQVLLTSLLLSWITAITVTPLFCHLLLKGGVAAQGSEVYHGAFFRRFRGVLALCLRRRWWCTATLAFLLGLSLYGFRFVDQSFFPSSTRQQFMVEVYLPRGAHIDETTALVARLEPQVRTLPGVTACTSIVGSGGLRFMLTYGAEKDDNSYAILLVDVDDYSRIDPIQPVLREILAQEFSEAFATIGRFQLGPGAKGKIRARFHGTDPDALRVVAEQTARVFESDPNAVGVRIDWRERQKVVVPVVAEAQAQRAGIGRPAIAHALQQAAEGVRAGVFREGDNLLPLIARAPAEERELGVESLYGAVVYSPVAGRGIPMQQVVTNFETHWEDPVVLRKNRERTIEVWCDPGEGLASPLFARLRPQVEALPLPEGCRLVWGGEYEDSAKGNASIAGNIPVPLILMILVVIVLFNALRQPLVIWLCVPLAIIGVTAGLLITGQPFGFMAMLGMLSLSGMLIKNAIVLIDQIEVEKRAGKHPHAAVLDATVSRLRPVGLAAVTTVMGMIPLFIDPFFAAMAVTIAFGLSFATVLTLIVVPVFYVIVFRLRPGV